jgi:hypothetical protein
MKLTPVDSEMLVAVGYEAKSHSLMTVFRTGETYLYKNVPLFVHERLMSADSKGKFMHKYVIGRFDYERVATTKSRGKRKHG